MDKTVKAVRIRSIWRGNNHVHQDNKMTLVNSLPVKIHQTIWFLKMTEVLINPEGYKIIEIILPSKLMTREGLIRVLSANRFIALIINKTLLIMESLQIEQLSVSVFILLRLDQVRKIWITKRYQVLEFWLRINYLMGRKVKIHGLLVKVQRNKIRNLKSKFRTLKRNKIKFISWSYKTHQMFVEDLSVGQDPCPVMVIMRVVISKLIECQVTIFPPRQNRNSTQSINTTAKLLIIYNQVKICGKMEIKILVKIRLFVNKIILSERTTMVVAQLKDNLIYVILQFIRITKTMKRFTIMSMQKKRSKSQSKKKLKTVVVWITKKIKKSGLIFIKKMTNKKPIISNNL